jgi:hypothetical protein
MKRIRKINLCATKANWTHQKRDTCSVETM